MQISALARREFSATTGATRARSRDRRSIAVFVTTEIFKLTQQNVYSIDARTAPNDPP